MGNLLAGRSGFTLEKLAIISSELGLPISELVAGYDKQPSAAPLVSDSASKELKALFKAATDEMVNTVKLYLEARKPAAPCLEYLQAWQVTAF